MYAVIFRATAGNQDPQYGAMVAQLRTLAFEQYGCKEFVAVSEGDQEIAISYWDSEQDILRWKQNATHLLAQSLGQSKWYESYSVEVMEIKRQYQFNRQAF